MLFTRLCSLALIVSASLTACNSYEPVNMDDKTNAIQAYQTIVGEVTAVFMQDREHHEITLVTKDGNTYSALISESNFGQKNAHQMQELTIGDVVEVIGEQSTLPSGVDNNSQITVRAMPYVLRKIIVADHKEECVGVGPQSCLLTKLAGSTNSQTGWAYQYSNIEGFDYEPHYEYILLIKNTTIANPPADASSIHSDLVEVIEKKRTTK